MRANRPRGPRKMVLRRWRQGFKLKAISREFRMGPTAVAKMLNESGVCWSHIATRERK